MSSTGWHGVDICVAVLVFGFISFFFPVTFMHENKFSSPGTVV